MLKGIKKKVLLRSEAKRNAEKFISSQDYFGEYMKEVEQ